jgi:hypothetical protein
VGWFLRPGPGYFLFLHQKPYRFFLQSTPHIFIVINSTW